MTPLLAARQAGRLSADELWTIVLGAHDQPRPEVVVRTVLWGLETAQTSQPAAFRTPEDDFVVLDESA